MACSCTGWLRRNWKICTRPLVRDRDDLGVPACACSMISAIPQKHANGWLSISSCRFLPLFTEVENSDDKVGASMVCSNSRITTQPVGNSPGLGICEAERSKELCCTCSPLVWDATAVECTPRSQGARSAVGCAGAAVRPHVECTQMAQKHVPSVCESELAHCCTHAVMHTCTCVYMFTRINAHTCVYCYIKTYMHANT